MLAPVTAGPALAAEVVLVRSGDSSAYTLAIAAFRKGAISSDVLEVDAKGVGSLEPAVVQKLRAAPPKVFVALGNSAAKAAKDSGVKAPVIFGFVMAPDKLGLAGPTFGGVSSEVPTRAQLQALAGLSPSIKKIGALHDAASAATGQALQAAASELGLTLVTKTVSGPTSLPPAVRQLVAEVDALIIVPDPALAAPESLKFVMRTALEASKPTLSWTDQHFASGALMVLQPSAEETGRLMSEMAGKVLKGDASYATIVAPSELRLSVNVRAAENIGIIVDATGAERDGNFASRTGGLDPAPILGVKGSTAIAAATPPPATPTPMAPTGGSGDGKPSVLEAAEAEYPVMARKQKKEGLVVLDVRVGPDGAVVETKVVRGSSMFNDAAIATIKKYKFAPARQGGQAVEGTVQVTINFKL